MGHDNMFRFPKFVVLAASFAVMAGCTPNGVSLDQSKVTAHPFPANYKQMIAQELKSVLYDPYSVRDAGITVPTWGVVGTRYGERNFVCVRLNSKNRYGGYVGLKYYVFSWENGVRSATEATIVCPEMTYKPFPELGNPN